MEGAHKCLGARAAAAFTLGVNPGPSGSRYQGKMKYAQAVLGELPCGEKWRELGKAQEPADPDASSIPSEGEGEKLGWKHRTCWAVQEGSAKLLGNP